MLRTWSLERRHEQDSPYYYAELPRGGRGSETNYTGQSLCNWVSVLLWRHPYTANTNVHLVYTTFNLRISSDAVQTPTATQHVALWLRDSQQSSRSTMPQPFCTADINTDDRVAGMIWSGFRPSDDAQVYGYNTAVNMYVFGAVVRAMKLNDVYWRQPRLAKLARDLCGTIKCAACDSMGQLQGVC